MPPKQPSLGSLAIQAPTSTQTIHVSPSLCHDLVVFKDLLKEYRKVDDSITVRLNRTNAQFRDRDRLGDSGKGSLQDQACAYFWQELVESWKRRLEVVDYCATVVDQAFEAEKKAYENQRETQTDPAWHRRSQSALFESEVKRNHVLNERTVERIVQQKSLDAFRSRCKYFTPPLSDAEGRKLWELALSRS